MDFQPIQRAASAFQKPVTSAQIQAICGRVFGPRARALSAIELSGGMYNNTYQVVVQGQDRPVVIRVAPEPGRQFGSERHLMRNEYASVPWLASLAPLMPRVLAADWSHTVIERDYLVQTLLDGVPAPERLSSYDRSTWPEFFRQLGSIAGQIHAIHGPTFGPVAGRAYPTWALAFAASLDDIATDLHNVGLDATDLRAIMVLLDRSTAILDEIVEPRLLAGDLWTVNVLLDATADRPIISGVLDLDRTCWGDPAADWTIRMAAAKPGTERDAFWDTYGPIDRSDAGQTRARLYEARHLGAIRLERHRLGNHAGVRKTYDDVAVVLAELSQDV